MLQIQCLGPWLLNGAQRAETLSNAVQVIFFFFPHQIFFIRLRICFDRGFPGGSVIKNPHANEADADSISGWGRSPGEGNGNPFQFSFLGNHMMVYGPWGGK